MVLGIKTLASSLTGGRDNDEEIAAATTAAPAAGANGEFALAISNFPPKLQEVLNEIDDEKNGFLEMDELTEVFTMYADMKKAEKEGCISITTLPKEIQPSLRVFDVDGDGTIAPMELARAAELYKDSRNQVKRLTRAVLVLFGVLVALIGTIVGLTVVVVENAKETKTTGSGVTLVAGSNTPAGAASVSQPRGLVDANDMSVGELSSISFLAFEDEAARSKFSYTITGWKTQGGSTRFYAARGDVITVAGDGAISIAAPDGSEVFSQSASTGRRLLQAGTPGAMMNMQPSASISQDDDGADSFMGGSAGFGGFGGFPDEFFGGFPDEAEPEDSDNDDSDSDGALAESHFEQPYPDFEFDFDHDSDSDSDSDSDHGVHFAGFPEGDILETEGPEVPNTFQP